MTGQPTSSPSPRDALASTLKRTEIQHSPSSIPGREIVQVLTQFPAGVEPISQPQAVADVIRQAIDRLTY